MSEVQRTKRRIQKELKTKNPPPLRSGIKGWVKNSFLSLQGL